MSTSPWAARLRLFLWGGLGMEPVWGAACAVMAGPAGPRMRPVEGGGMMRAAVAGEGQSPGLDLPAVTHWNWSGKGTIIGLKSGAS